MGLGKVLSEEAGQRSLIRRLLVENARAHVGRYAAAFVFMAVMAASTALSAYVLRYVINNMFGVGDTRLPFLLAGIVFALFAVKGLATYLSNVILARIGNAVVARNQRLIYDHLLLQGVDFFKSHASADLVTRIAYAAAAVRDVLNLLVTALGRDLLTVIALGIVMVVQEPILSLGAVVVMPVAVWGVNKLRRRARSVAQSEYALLNEMVGVVQETVQGVQIVKSYRLEDQMRARMYSAIAAVESRANKMARLTARTSPLMETLGGMAIAFVIAYGGWRVVTSGHDPGSFVSFIGSLLLAYDPAKRLARLHVELENGLVGARRMFDLIDSEPTLKEVPGARELLITEGAIRFEAVDFSYRDDTGVLKGLTFEAAGGKVTALVGPSGAGKSTVMNLVQRFYDPSSGAITIDGQDIREVTFASLRGQIGFVAQDSFLFAGTVGENIALGRPGASHAEIEAAARAADAHAFIAAMPEGYATEVGEDGTMLSGGQRQRIAIARALLKNAPIMLMDEATSALDSESEYEIRQALERLMQGRTVLVIAHRLSTVMRADKILVIEGGQVVERGTHAELNARGGLYSGYVARQFEGAAVEAG